MIKLNLLGIEKTTDTNALLWLLGIIFSLLTAAIICTILSFSLNSQLADSKILEADLTAQLNKLKVKTKEASDLEKKRDVLSKKIEVIAKLKLSKIGPVRVLDDLNISVPARAWVTDVIESGNNITLKGFALDGQTVATFMDALEHSKYFGNIKVETKQTSRDGVKIQNFSLESSLSYAGELKYVDDIVGGRVNVSDDEASDVDKEDAEAKKDSNKS